MEKTEAEDEVRKARAEWRKVDGEWQKANVEWNKAYAKLKKAEAEWDKAVTELEKVEFRVYYCERCDRYTDVRYISDKKGGRNKSYCYLCGNEMLISCKVIREAKLK